MTTIAYRQGVMAADTRAYAGFNGQLGEKTKIRRLPDGTMIGASTNQVGLGEALLNWYEAGADPAKAPGKLNESKFTLLVVKPEGEAFYAYDTFMLSGPVRAEFYAIGSGAEYALGAMAHGAGPEYAVEIACQYDVWSAAPVMALTRAHP
jgi:hypothetical protein